MIRITALKWASPFAQGQSRDHRRCPGGHLQFQRARCPGASLCCYDPQVARFEVLGCRDPDDDPALCNTAAKPDVYVYNQRQEAGGARRAGQGDRHCRQECFRPETVDEVEREAEAREK
jgi:hypothetical protein